MGWTMESKFVVLTSSLGLLLLAQEVSSAPISKEEKVAKIQTAPRPTDLAWHIERAMDNIVRWTEPFKDVDPVEAVQKGMADRPWYDLTHNVGRAIDGLLKGESATGKRPPEKVIAQLRSLLFATLDNEAGFSGAYDRDTKKLRVMSHDLREAAQALLELGIRRQDQEALDRLGKLMETLLDITDGEGAYRPDAVHAKSMLRPEKPLGTWSAFTDEGDLINTPPNGGFYHPQATTVDRGRLIMALTQVYQHTGDTRALELARRFVRRVRTHSFAEDGQLLQDAGSHTHSITGTVHGLAHYGSLTRDLDTSEHARRIFDKGLAPTRSSFGWSVENAWRESLVGRGEINNTGDMIQTAIHLGRTGYPEYFEMAERMVRSHVLPSQWLKGQEFHRPADAPENALKEFPTHADGGWGFPGVNDRHVPGGRSAVLDITQGGVQCLWAVLHHSIDQDQWGVRLNMAFSSESEAARVISQIPKEGRVTITLKREASLWYRKPSWVPWKDFSVRVQGKPLAVRRIGTWAVTSKQESGTVLEAMYPLVRRQQEEWIHHKRYRFVYEGDTIVAMTPRGTYAPMYQEIKE